MRIREQFLEDMRSLSDQEVTVLFDEGSSHNIKEFFENGSFEKPKGIVGVVGVGKVGTELAVALRELGYIVVGFDQKDYETERLRYIATGNKEFPYLQAKGDYRESTTLKSTLHEKLKFLGQSKFDAIFHTYIEGESDAVTFVNACRGLTDYAGMMSTVHTYKNPYDKRIVIGEDSPKITQGSMENGQYADDKHRAEIAFKSGCEANSLNQIIIYANHLLGGNGKRSIFEGYPLGIEPSFRSLSKEALQGSEELRISGNYEYNVMSVKTLGEVIAGALDQKVAGDLIVGNPKKITTEAYLRLSALVHGVIQAKQGFLNDYRKLTNDFNRRIIITGDRDGLEVESMSRNWVLNLQRMNSIFPRSDEFWGNSHAQSFRESAVVPINPDSRLIQKMKGQIKCD